MFKRHYILVVAILLLAISCQKKNSSDFNGNISIIVSDAGSGIQWQNGQVLKVIGIGSESSIYADCENEEGNTSTFKGSLKGESGENYTIYAVSPASAYESSFSGARIKMTLPSIQSSLQTAPDPEADFLVSEPHDITLSGKDVNMETYFRRISSVMRIQPSGIEGERILSLSIEAQDVNLAGTVSVDLERRSIGSLAGVGSSIVSVSLEKSMIICGSDAVCIAVLPASMANGAELKVKLRTDKGIYSKTLKAGSDGVPTTFAAGETVTVPCAISEEDAIEEVELRVMSFNIKAGYDSETGEHSWPKRKEGQRQMMREWMPDIIGINEADAPQRNYYAENFPEYNFVTVTNVPQQGADYKQSGLNEIGFKSSRFTLLDSGWYWLSETPDKVSLGYDFDGYLTAIWAKLEDKENGRMITFVCTHLAAGDKNNSRAYSSQLVVDRTMDMVGNDDVVFIVGDMNAADYSGTSVSGYPGYRKSIQPFYDYLQDARNTAATTVGNYSLNHWGEWSKHVTLNIDMIYYRNIKSADCFTTVTAAYNNTEYISDHYPVVLDCKY